MDNLKIRHKAITQKEFEMIKLMLNAGAKPSKVREVMGFGKKSSVIYMLKRFDTLEAYLVWNRERQKLKQIKEAGNPHDYSGSSFEGLKKPVPTETESIYPYLERIENGLLTIAKLLNVLISQTKEKKGWFN